LSKVKEQIEKVAQEYSLQIIYAWLKKNSEKMDEGL